MPDMTVPAAEMSFSVRRILDAPIDLAWKAWSDHEMVKQWWGPEGFTAPMCRMDFREGGTTLVSMRSADFGELFNTWSYTSIVPKRRIEFVARFSDSAGNQLEPASIGLPPDVPSEVPHVITFEDLGDGRTGMTVTERGYSSQQALELSKAGQEQVVEKFVRSVERAKSAGSRA